MREVTLTHPCDMGRYEVTFLQYDRYVWANGGKGASPDRYAKDAGFGRMNRPVINVSWTDAEAYTRWLGPGWRLPSEAEWEYAARGGREASYPWGDKPPKGRANCRDCGGEFGGKSTAPVGSYPATGFGAGLYDMAGNVWEWVADGTNSGSRVVRGGSWGSYPKLLRAAFRNGLAPDDRDVGIGFRVCRVAPIEKPTTGAVDAGPPARCALGAAQRRPNAFSAGPPNSPTLRRRDGGRA